MYFMLPIQCEDVFSLPNAFTTIKQNSEQRCRDGVMNEFVSWCRHLLVSFLFHALTSLHLPSFYRNNFPLVYIALVGSVCITCREVEHFLKVCLVLCLHILIRTVEPPTIMGKVFCLVQRLYFP